MNRIFQKRAKKVQFLPHICHLEGRRRRKKNSDLLGTTPPPCQMPTWRSAQDKQGGLGSESKNNYPCSNRFSLKKRGGITKKVCPPVNLYPPYLFLTTGGGHFQNSNPTHSLWKSQSFTPPPGSVSQKANNIFGPIFFGKSKKIGIFGE